MTAKELKRLRRGDLLEMMLDLSKENQQLRRELEEAQKQLENRMIAIEESGSLAEATLRLNGFFEAAQAVSEQYIQNIRQRSLQMEQICRQMEQETKAKCDAMIAQARKQAEDYLEEATRKAQRQQEFHSWLTDLIENAPASDERTGNVPESTEQD